MQARSVGYNAVRQSVLLLLSEFIWWLKFRWRIAAIRLQHSFQLVGIREVMCLSWWSSKSEREKEQKQATTNDRDLVDTH